MSNTPSDAEILALAQEHLKAFAQFVGAGEVWFEGEVEFARAIEAEVRKQDEALIRQMLEALDDGSEHSANCITHYYMRPCDCKNSTVIAAARARLGEATLSASSSS